MPHPNRQWLPAHPLFRQLPYGTLDCGIVSELHTAVPQQNKPTLQRIQGPDHGKVSLFLLGNRLRPATGAALGGRSLDRPRTAWAKNVTGLSSSKGRMSRSIGNAFWPWRCGDYGRDLFLRLATPICAKIAPR